MKFASTSIFFAVLRGGFLLHKRDLPLLLSIALQRIWRKLFLKYRPGF